MNDLEVQVFEVDNTLTSLELALNDASADITDLTSQVSSVEAELEEPRPCPNGTVPLGEASCVEAGMRDPGTFYQMMDQCLNEGLRPYSAAEVSRYCDQLDGVLDPPYNATGEWSSAVAGQYEEAQKYKPAWVALGLQTETRGGSPCTSVRLVGTESSSTEVYPFRCCYDRL